MGAVVRRLAERYEWSGSIANFSEKLRRGSLRYREALELADTLGYDLVWRKRGEAQNG
ncbi:MAG: LLM class flavin-dependent oxidoreductase [Abditibacteriota bacterium]|nr:LLM class flavin-dependent oxidoreductase [Abditibacteriota bacterium]